MIKTTQQEIKDSYQLISTIGEWHIDKLYRYPDIAVQTCHTTVGDQYWVGRSNTITDTNGDLYLKFLQYLIGWRDGVLDKEMHTKYEKEYIHALQSYTVIPSDQTDYLQVRLIYDIGVMLSKREFNERILFQPPTPHSVFGGAENEEISMVISTPLANPTTMPGTVPAVYHSIERIIYNKDTRDIKWDMVTSSNAKGNLPMWLQKMGINKSISEDVPSFLLFIAQK